MSPNRMLPETLTTERLTLVTPAPRHVPAMARLANNRAVVQNLSRLPFPYQESDAEFFVANIARQNGDWPWCIELDGEMAGVIGVRFDDGQLPELGYWLGESYWGRGIASEAVAVVISSVRATGRFPGLRSRALKSNAASLNVQHKLGFRIVGEGIEPEGSNLAGQEMVLSRLDFAATGPRDALPEIIETPRLVLRAPMPDDLENLVTLINNPRIVDMTASLNLPYTEEDGRAFTERFANKAENRVYAIADRSGTFMGVVGLKLETGTPPELGYWLGEPHWGRGYASEAVAALLDAVREAGVATVKARALADNKGSIRVLEKAGFRFVEAFSSTIERHLGRTVNVLEWSAA